MNKFRLLLAEDHETVRAGIRLLVDAQPDMEVVGEAGDGRSAVEKTHELTPDIVVMDISMPEMNGLIATKRIRRSSPQVKILALTRHESDGYLQQMLGAGASGYVLKQSAPSELINAIRAVGAGNSYLDQSLTGKVMGGYVRQSISPEAAGAVKISRREEEVLRLLALGNSYKDIAAEMLISIKTVEVHKSNLMRKLDFKSRADIVRYAILQGWMKDS